MLFIGLNKTECEKNKTQDVPTYENVKQNFTLGG